MSDTPSVLALIPACGRMPENDLAMMHQARRLADQRGGHAHALLAGPGSTAATAQAREAGLDHVWLIPDGGTDTQPHQYADLYAAALRTAALSSSLEHALLLIPAHPDNDACAGALAARISAAPLGRCSGFEFNQEGHLTARRTAYGGRINIALSCATGPAIASVRPQARAAATGVENHAATAPTVHELPVAAAVARPPHAITAAPHREPHAGLDGARLVISGGRGMGGEAAFAALYELADRLDGAVGASLPAVDSGWAPVTRQVGISGKYVSPDIYLAIGISGTPQHLAGIDPHTRIIAINRDADAAIFGVAEVGALAEWQALLPALLQALD
ncbi:electron transfer flavoprotein subunit alpha/FixB family protein [Castellaniella sp. GW247-6E4]|uniref:electron transfer flavoprotein subunit alpha/FixB family protein n=1 Tax=Castellaniella sp. GW247-6E4 TaxID=3140380 RepID=UPI003315C0E7